MNRAFTSQSKQRAREHVIDVLRAYPALWSPGAKTLRGDLVELLGESGHLSIETYERAGVLRPGGFVGVDTDPALVDRYRRQYPQYKFICGDVRTRSLFLTTQAEVGTAYLDGFAEIGGRNSVSFIQQFGVVIRRGIELFTSFAFFLNCSVDAVIRNSGSRSKALRNHADLIAAGLKDYWPRRSVDIGEVLPRGAEKEVDDSSFTGKLGAFNIYKGEDKKQRMALLGLVL